MNSCAHCNKKLILSGKTVGGLPFCTAKCCDSFFDARLGRLIPPDVLENHVRALHAGQCPRCGADGPVNLHVSRRVWSVFVYTSSTTRNDLCCASCGIKRILLNTVVSAALGWWDFPAGLILVPVAVFANLRSLFGAFDHHHDPTDEMKNAVRQELARAVRTKLLALLPDATIRDALAGVSVEEKETKNADR